MKRLKLYPELMVMVTLAVITRFWHLFVPNATVFDEVYFKVFAGHYFDGAYYFDIHPPLGKLLLALLANIFGYNAQDLLNEPALMLRILPAAAGVLLVPLVWAILRRLGVSRLFATLGASLILLDGALLVESRFILMDSLLLLFGLSAVYLYLVARGRRGLARLAWLSAACLAAGAAASIKWTGLTALALIGLAWIWDTRKHATWPQRAREFAIFAVVPTTLYISAFAVHFALLPKTGDGDAFMTQKFQSTLKESVYYQPAARMSFPEKFLELNAEMYRANQTLTATHPYSSRWYTWPVLGRPIYYWQGPTLTESRQGNIYLMGNPLVWWGILVAAIGGLFALANSKTPLSPKARYGLGLTGLAYLINLLPFIAVTRVMFLYHYFFAFLFSLMFVVILLDNLTHGMRENPQAKRAVTLAVTGTITVIALAFVYFSPLYYGTPLTPSQLAERMWLKTWR